MTRATLLLALLTASALAAPVEPQPFLSATARLIDAMEFTSSPFPSDEKAALTAAIAAQDAAAVERAQAVLDAHTLFVVSINPEQRVKVAAGTARPELDEAGWREFLVKVINDAGTTAQLVAHSPDARTVYGPGAQRDLEGGPAHASHWLDLQMFEAPPLRKTLSGLGVEYRIIRLYSHDAGKREATFAFDTGQGTQDLGFRNEVSILFNCLPTHKIKLSTHDENGAPCLSELVMTTVNGRDTANSER